MHTNPVTKEPQPILFVGAPNSGKTTLYNWVTGSRFKTVNYPGATVDYAVGKPLANYKADLTVLDTPGIYGLAAQSEEERVTEELLFGDGPYSKGKLLVVVVDATQMSRQLLLADHLKESGFEIVVVLTMVDILRNQGQSVSVATLTEQMGVPVVAVDGRLGGNIKALIEVIKTRPSQRSPVKLTSWDQQTFELKFQKYDKMRDLVLNNSKGIDLAANSSESVVKILDKYLMHPVFGLLFFVLIMFGLFSSVFWLAAPAIDFVDGIFSDLAGMILALAPGALWAEFLGNGLVAGVGALAVFIPQIAILFLGLNILEDSGYLARASTLIDRPLSRIGLNGRAFVPILSSFACAVPGMMAARTMPNKRERFLTLFILPLMTCSARLPVYALLLGFIFNGESAWLAGGVLALLYFASLFLGGLVSVVINKFLPKSSESFFLLEIPSFRRPVFRKTLRSVYDRTMSFATRAGPIIFVLSVVIWAGSTFPNYEESNLGKRFQTSYAAQVGHYVEPIFEPMGVDWRVGLGIITSFAAREVFVSTLAVVFNVSEEATGDESLLSKMRQARFETNDGSVGKLIFSFPTVIAIVVFFMIALQCMATVGVAKNEFGGWKLALVQLAFYNLAAYALAVGAYQLLSA